MTHPTRIKKDVLWSKKNTYWFKRRANEIANFIDEWKEPIADMGDRNPLIEFLEEHLHFSTTAIDGIDFDKDEIDGQYGTIFCFAILEHLFNPLFALENMKKALIPDGILYLATPGRPHFLWTEHHFHEIDDKRIEWLFDRAGFQIVKSRKAYLRRRLREHLTGIRPLIRYFHKSMRLYKLKPIQNKG